ncbi:hypothetical protein BJ508DRAFT_304872 [Ascobolus immersus RN42]|uniref:Uncharacterized protein n=1 Tax=Ascobolus immersus RN42 TaxID=1160509 RepID=A0A3N4ICE1_ASCIM|nr:hypothetical protein BJ508DRAFT_304872 [Ascobolus immersus RN42]
MAAYYNPEQGFQPIGTANPPYGPAVDAPCHNCKVKPNPSGPYRPGFYPGLPIGYGGAGAVPQIQPYPQQIQNPIVLPAGHPSQPYHTIHILRLKYSDKIRPEASDWSDDSKIDTSILKLAAGAPNGYFGGDSLDTAAITKAMNELIVLGPNGLGAVDRYVERKKKEWRLGEACLHDVSVKSIQGHVAYWVPGGGSYLQSIMFTLKIEAQEV